MDTHGRLIAGSHNRNEFILINADEYAKVNSVTELSGQICQICGDEIEMTVETTYPCAQKPTHLVYEPFVACNECAFPICRPCYEYERRDGNQACPQCKTRFKRIKGSPRVDGDEEEDGFDDLANEFDLRNNDRRNPHSLYEYSSHINIDASNISVFATASEVDGAAPSHEMPLLTYGQEDDDSHALIIPPFMGRSKRVHPTQCFDTASSVSLTMDPKKDIAVYGYGTVAWKDRMEEWRKRQADKLEIMKHQGNDGGGGHDGDLDDEDLPMMDEGRQPLSRKLPIPSSKINPYRMVILMRMVILGLFFHYRILHPVNDAYGLWLTSVICEIWFAVSWILDQFPKWLPIERETYLDRLSLRYEKEGKASELAPIDVYVSTVDPLKEPPLITANTVLSILAVDYPVDKVACYVSDDGAAMLTFEALSETSEFARKWVPFCKKFNIEPRAPEWYFAEKVDYLKDKVHPAFVCERRAMKRDYEEFKVRINGLVSMAQKVPEDGWTMQDGTPWPGNNVRDHPGMIQVFLGNDGVRDVEGNELPPLVYVSREKRPGFDHHKKAGAMNALIRVSAVITNAPYMLNVDCDHYINNSKAFRESMCFMMDPISGKKICYVQFPQRFDGIDRHDRYSNRNVVFFDINMKGLDGIQGPIYVGTGCVFRRQALYGFDAPVRMKPPGKTCNCLPQWCLCCFSSRKKKIKGNAKKKTKKMKKMMESSIQKHSQNIEEGNAKKKMKKMKKIMDTSTQIHALENIEEGIEGIDSERSLLMPHIMPEDKFGQYPLSSEEIDCEKSSRMPHMKSEKKAGQSPVFMEEIDGERSLPISQIKLEKKFGQSPVFIASTLIEDGGVLPGASSASLLKEAIHVISCGYEDKTEWGKEVGWIYGSVTEDILTGFKMHCHGWRSVYCIPKRPAFKGSAPINLSDRLHQVLRWALGSVEILLSKHCPIWYGYGCGLKPLERLSYINSVVYPLTSVPLVAYCTLPAVCLLSGKFIVPEISNYASIIFMLMFLSIAITSVLEIQWGGVGIDDFWRNEQFWVIGGVSSHLFALFQGLLKVLAGVNTNFTVTSKGGDDGDFAELYIFKWTSLLIPPLTLLAFNVIGVVIGISDAINNGYESWGPLFGKLFFAIWVILHLYPFLKGVMGKQRTVPTIILVWTILLSSILTLVWVRSNPFVSKDGLVLDPCGLDCN